MRYVSIISKNMGRVFVAAVLLSSQLTPFVALNGRVSATEVPLDQEFTICHRTNSASNPYETLTVPASAIDGVGQGDHYGEHTGPVVTSQAEAQDLKSNGIDWGDIIPPLPGIHTGLNWSPEGQAIVANGCDYVIPPAEASVSITKFVRNENGRNTPATQFDVQLNSSSLTPGPLQIFNNGNTATTFDSVTVPAGEEFTITETQAPGYELLSIACQVGNTRVAHPYTPAADEEVNCNVVNRDLPEPTVTVTKFVRYENGGNTPATAFPVELNDSALVPGPLQTFNNGNTATEFESVQVASGQEFTITEDGTPGYELVNITCKVGDTRVGHPYAPNPGEHVTCNVVNRDVAPSVTVTKFLRLENGGTGVATDFTVYLNDDELNSGPLQEFNNGNSAVAFDSVSVPTGQSFTITEDDVDGFELFYIQCFVNDVSVGYPYSPALGEDVDCNVINRDLPPATVVATKIVCNNESLLPNFGTGGPNITAVTALEWVANNDGCSFAEGWNFEWAKNNTPNPGDNVEVGGANWTPFGPTDTNGQTSVEVRDLDDLNRLWIREQLQNGYLGFTFNENNRSNVDDESAELYCHRDVLNYDNFDYIRNLAYGRTYHCVAWNVAFGEIRAIKYHDLNQNGTRDGAAEPRLDGWEMTVYDEQRDIVAQGLTGENGDGRVTFTDLLPGTYYVCETQKSGWERTEPADSDCRKVVLDPQESAVARFGNIQYGRLKVNKIVRNNNGGTAGPTQFGIDINGDKYRFNRQGMIGVALLPGVYNANELTYEGYEQIRSTCGEVVVKPGETTTCRIVNSDIPPKVIVKKQVLPYYASDDFNFVLRNNGERYDRFTLDGIANDDNTTSMYMTDNKLQAGRINIIEDAPRNWVLRDVRCYMQSRIDLEKKDVVYDQRYFTPPFRAEIGKTYVCEFLNVKKGTVTVTKYHDYNENGMWDENEPTLSDWDMTLTRERHTCGLETNQNILTTRVVPQECLTDASLESRTRNKLTDSDGQAVFRNVRPGTYTVDEVLQTGWIQSSIQCMPDKEFVEQEISDEFEQDVYTDSSTVRVRPGGNVDCYVGNYREPQVQIEKFNDTTGPVQRTTEVTFTITVQVPTVDESGALRGAMDGPDYLPVTVTDFLTDEFDYIPGSFTATSSERGDLVAAGITSDPNYASPGTWVLTSLASNVMTPGELVTLTYRALVGETVPAGTYPTDATVIGYGDIVTVTATDTDDDQVVVIVPAVLGTQTTLEATGTDIMLWQMITGLALIAFALSTVRRKNIAVS